MTEEKEVKKISELEAYKLEVFHLEADKHKQQKKNTELRVECARLKYSLHETKMELIKIEIGQLLQHQETFKEKIEKVTSEREGLVSEIKARLGIEGPLEIDPDTLEVIDNNQTED